MPNHISVTTTFDKNKYELKTTMESGQWHSTLLMDGAELTVIEHKVPIYTVLHQLDQKIIYPHYYFKHLTEKYFEIGMKLDDFSIQLVKYCNCEIRLNFKTRSKVSGAYAVGMINQ